MLVVFVLFRDSIFVFYNRPMSMNMRPLEA